MLDTLLNPGTMTQSQWMIVGITVSVAAWYCVFSVPNLPGHQGVEQKKIQTQYRLIAHSGCGKAEQ